MGDAARALAQDGFPVFPCWERSKKPATKNGCKDATTDTTKIDRLWRKLSYNVGLATGHKHRDTGCYLAVVDIDVNNGKVGRASLEELVAKYGALPETRRVRTGSGGTHYYFLTRGALQNRANSPAKHIDIRGSGGYVIAPPSIHECGSRYEWENPDTPIAMMPEWLVGLLTGGKSKLAERTPASSDVSAISHVNITPDDAPPPELEESSHASIEEIREALHAIPPELITGYDGGSSNPGAWWEVGAALHSHFNGGDNGFKLWDEFSKRDPEYAKRYSMDLLAWKRDLQKHWSNFKDDRFKVATIFHYAKKNHAYCQAQSQQAAARVNESVSDLIQSGWVYCLKTQEFISPELQERWNKSQFSDKFAPSAPKRKTFADVCLRNPDFVLVNALTFAPKRDRILVEDGQQKLNLWRPSALVPRAGDVTRFLEHVKFMLPNEHEQTIFLQYLGFLVQHQGEKVRWSIILQGKPGTGKSYFGHVMGEILGHHNVSRPTNDRLHETWTNWQEGAQLIVIEELMGYGRQELMNKLKPMITEPTTMVRLVGGCAYEMPNRYNFLMFTNHKTALKIEQGERRYCILFSPAEPRQEGYYNELWRWTDSNIAAIAHHLENLSLAGFNPNSHAPETDARKQAIEMSRSDLLVWIEDGRDNCHWPFNGLIVIEHLLKLLPDHLQKPRPAGNAIAEALDVAGAKQLRKRMKLQYPLNGYPHAWAFGDPDELGRWEAMTEGKLGQAYLESVKAAAGLSVPVTDLPPDVLTKIAKQQQLGSQLLKETLPM